LWDGSWVLALYLQGANLKYKKKLKRQTYVNLSVKKAKNKFEKVNGHGFCSPIQLRIANFLRFV
jgi:hypothetical protein